MAKILVPTTGTVIASTWGKSVADALNDMLVQRGVANLNMTGGLSPVTTYPVAFGAGPVVVASPLDTQIVIVTVVYASLTTTGFQVRGYTYAGAPVPNGNMSIAWIAIGAR